MALAAITAVRRVGVSMVGLATALVVLGGCSSATSGSGGGGAGAASTGAPFGGGSATGGVPSGGAPSGSGGGGDFCSEWAASGSSGTGLTGGQVRANFVAHWDRLAQTAPAEIKSDVQRIDDYLHAVLSGHYDPSAARALASSVASVVEWTATNCH